MKPQDILFIIILLLLFWKRNPTYFVVVGLACIVCAMPLFAFWIFFTAERFVWYAITLLFIAILFLFKKNK